MEQFKTEVVASIVSGKLMSDFSELHEAIEKLSGSPIWTHQLPDAGQQLRPLIEAALPKLTSFDFSNVTIETVHSERDRLISEVGKTVELKVPLIENYKSNPF